jgi:hypothetical protein
MRYFGVAGNITKPDARTAIDAAYDWIYDTGAKTGGTANKAALKQYLTANAPDFDSKATNDQVSALFSAVVLEDASLLDVVGG